MRSNQPLDIRTIAVHAGERPDPTTRASSPNLVMSSTFTADHDTSFSVEGMDEETPFFYGRWANPTVAQLEEKLAALEGAEAGLAFGSGMAAISAVLMDRLGSGDHAVISDVAYAGASELAGDLLPQMGIRIDRVDTSDLEALERAVKPETKLVYVETPCNPLVRLTDLEAAADIAHRGGAKLVVDSTFATPIATRPISLGVDFVIHSLTKYIGGHGDAIGGGVLGRSTDLMRLRQRMTIRVGGVLSPFNAWLIMRGIATLPLRMVAHADGGQRVAHFLERHPKVMQVSYPGLASHPQHELARRQMENFSGMIAVQTSDGAAAARVLSERLEIIHYAVSLGHHCSLIVYLPTVAMLENSFDLSPDQERSYRAYAGDGIFRLSVGIEDPEDLCRDLDQALTACP